MAEDRETTMAKLRESTKVDFLTATRGGDTVLVMSKDKPLVDSLVARGGHARWYDRCQFSTQKGGEPVMQAEVQLGPKFFGEE
jgi:hypothetical protein